MRVIDPKQRERMRQQQRRSKKGRKFLFVFLVIIAGALLLKTQIPNDSPVKDPLPFQAPAPPVQQPAKTGKLKTFTADQFKDLYNTFSYPNTAPINEHTPITGDERADQRIKQIAGQRGYKIRSAPVANAFVDVGGGHVLQQRAAQPWQDLKAAAASEGIRLGLTSGYRSADEQKQIFLQRLFRTGASVPGIAAGLFDAQVSQVLSVTAPPGYSRHHTGYTIDLTCQNQPNSSFEYSVCFRWLSSNNYEKAKTHGWIPGYPEGTGNQGPEPEAWEYVWVGKEALTE